MFELILPFYSWIKALHVISVISWMAGLFYLPRIFVYHAEKATIGSELDLTFRTMEKKLLRVIMTPAMIATWFFGLLLVFLGGMNFAEGWSWVKLVSVFGMTVVHFWLSSHQKAFENGSNKQTGRTFRLVNEIPTVLMIVIVVAVIVRPF